MQHKRVQIDDIAIFYREIGRPGAPKLLLLHGLPGSSHQHRDLMRKLGDRFHIVAPDFPGFGHSDRPDPDGFEYTFEVLTRTIAAFCRRVGFTRLASTSRAIAGRWDSAFSRRTPTGSNG